jgi:hypothetical protein
MVSKRSRRWLMLLLFVGGPLLGWLMLDDRGLLFGLIVSVLAVGWFLVEEKHLL